MEDSNANDSPFIKRPIDPLVGGEDGEDSRKSRKRMLGKEVCVTCGDLTLLSVYMTRYNETYAASEVS